MSNEIPRKSVAAYLSKYLSKIDSKGYGTKDKFKINHWFTKQEIELAPCRWATYNKTSRQLLKKHTVIWQSPVKHRVPDLINYANKIASRLENNNLIKKRPVRVVRAKSQKNGINKGESYILMDKSLNENNPLISQRKSIDIPFNNYYESIWLKDENDVGVQGYLRKFNYADLHSYFDQEYYSYMCIRQLSDYSHKRVNNWLTQLVVNST